MKGKTIVVLSSNTDEKAILVSGKWIRIAAVQDEEWLEGQVVNDPKMFIYKMKQNKIKADIFTFLQKLPNNQPQYKYYLEWDNVAAIPITCYDDWWNKLLTQVTRKSVRRAEKRGVIAKVIEFNDELVQGIISIHNDTPMRQGRPFAHYGKSCDLVRKEYGTYLNSTEFLGAYLGSELIGIIKLLYLGEIASIMEILTKTKHYDKRPGNILIAKAVEVCEKKGISYLIYGKYIYGKTNSSLTEFKRRNGFAQFNIPRYYIPLTLRGRVILKLKLHRGLISILPGGVISFLRDIRFKYYQIKLLQLKSARKLQSSNSE